MQTVTTKPPLPRSPTRSVSSAPRPGRKKYIFFAVVGVVAIFLVIAGIKVLQIFSMIQAGKAMTPPPTTVTSAMVKQANWQPILTAVGSVSPVQGAMISAEIPGTVAQIGFKSGQPVKKGELLLSLDASSEIAQLRSAQAEAELAKADAERAQDLSDRKVISKAELDAAKSKYAQKQAMTENMQAVIDKKEIHAPFDGVAGVRTVNPGQTVAAGDPLVSLQALSQVFVDFSLPQHDLPKLSLGLPVEVTTDAIPGRTFEGKLTAINSSIDAATRSISLQATLDNSDHALRAGMFARVNVLLPEKNTVLFIPTTAVAYAPYGNSVYLIERKHDDKSGKDQLTLRQQFIRTGDTRGDFISVQEGLKEGQEVVSTGVFKLRNNMNVVVDNKLAPEAKIAPNPPNS
jgi:membrane fusion protein (multidrug efflux system)